MTDQQTYIAPDIHPRLAAIDVGSNSIRLVVAEAQPGGRYRVLDEERETTRLAKSLATTGELDEASIDAPRSKRCAASSRSPPAWASKRSAPSPPAPCARRPTASSSAAACATKSTCRSRSSTPIKRPVWRSKASAAASTSPARTRCWPTSAAAAPRSSSPPASSSKRSTPPSSAPCGWPRSSTRPSR